MNLFKLICEDWQTVKKNDPALHSRFELFFNYPGLWALFFYRIAHWFFEKGLRLLPRFISAMGMFLTTIDIHPGATLGRRVFIDHGTGVVIGETAVVKNDVLIYQQVTLGGVSTNKGKRHPTIEENVIIGTGAKILGNITIGKFSKVGANSVVVKDVPSNSTAVGIPARVITRGFDKSPLSHNKIPDINKEIFAYLLKRIELLEDALPKNQKEMLKPKDEALESFYDKFIHSMD